MEIDGQKFEELKQAIKQVRVDVQQDIREASRNTQDLLMQEIRASEHRIKSELRQEIHRDIYQAKQETIEAVAELLDANVLPQMDDHEKRLTRLEVKSA